MRSMRLIAALVALLLSATGAADETPHFAFVTEYVRELGVNEALRELTLQDATEPDEDKNAAMAADGTRIAHELNSQIAIMKGMKLNAPFDSLPVLIAEAYQQKIQAYNQMTAIAVDSMGGPKPGIDYVKFVFDRPRLAALIEHADRALAEITPLIFASLIAHTPDNQGMRRLEITRADRDALVRTLQTDFGDKMDQSGGNHIVRSARELRDYLTSKDDKCSDDPL